MEEEPPQPDDPARDHTAAPHKRQRTDSESSTSLDSIQSTRTLQSEDLEFVHENNRIYGDHSYFMPCDQTEQDRLTIQHQVFVYALKGKLTTTRITPATRRILDLGTGPGNWAVAMAQQYPHAEVVGIDMTAWDIETTEGEAGAGRVTWEIDNLDVWGTDSEMDELTSKLEWYDPFRDPTARIPIDSPSKSKGKEPQTQPQSPLASEPSFNPYILEPEAQLGWHFSEPYDLIHLRNLKGTFAYWEDVYAEIYKNLSPGGWIEVGDYEIVLPEMINSPDDPGVVSSSKAGKRPLTHEFALPCIRRLYLSMMQASFKSGRPLGSYYMHPTYLEDAGFKDVTTTYVNVPVGTWPEDEEQKKIGKMFLVVFMESLEPHCLRLLTKYGDAEKIWTLEEVNDIIEQAKKEVMEWGDKEGAQARKEGWCANFKWVVGRKSKNA
ncbi:uncharacterized protein BDR25DRAFT_272613 [Lindgomyces ingoldianus]